MKRHYCTTAVLVLSLVFAPALARAQADAAAEVDGYRAEFLRALATRQQKYLALARAIPEGKYTWRPMEGVRSPAEVLLHVAAANFFYPSFAGTEPPEDFEAEGYEQSTTDKQEIIDEVRRSFEHLRAAVIAAPDEPEREVRWYGGSTTTHRALLLGATGHLAEHLGQLIAYARVKQIVPPWNRGG